MLRQVLSAAELSELGLDVTADELPAPPSTLTLGDFLKLRRVAIAVFAVYWLAVAAGILTFVYAPSPGPAPSLFVLSFGLPCVLLSLYELAVAWQSVPASFESQEDISDLVVWSLVAVSVGALIRCSVCLDIVFTVICYKRAPDSNGVLFLLSLVFSVLTYGCVTAIQQLRALLSLFSLDDTFTLEQLGRFHQIYALRCRSSNTLDHPFRSVSCLNGSFSTFKRCWDFIRVLGRRGQRRWCPSPSRIQSPCVTLDRVDVLCNESGKSDRKLKSPYFDSNSSMVHRTDPIKEALTSSFDHDLPGSIQMATAVQRSLSLVGPSHVPCQPLSPVALQRHKRTPYLTDIRGISDTAKSPLEKSRRHSVAARPTNSAAELEDPGGGEKDAQNRRWSASSSSSSSAAVYSRGLKSLSSERTTELPKMVAIEDIKSPSLVRRPNPELVRRDSDASLCEGPKGMSSCLPPSPGHSSVYTLHYEMVIFMCRIYLALWDGIPECARSLRRRMGVCDRRSSIGASDAADEMDESINVLPMNSKGNRSAAIKRAPDEQNEIFVKCGPDDLDTAGNQRLRLLPLLGGSAGQRQPILRSPSSRPNSPQNFRGDRPACYSAPTLISARQQGCADTPSLRHVKVKEWVEAHETVQAKHPTPAEKITQLANTLHLLDCLCLQNLLKRSYLHLDTVEAHEFAGALFVIGRCFCEDLLLCVLKTYALISWPLNLWVLTSFVVSLVQMVVVCLYTTVDDNVWQDIVASD